MSWSALSVPMALLSACSLAACDQPKEHPKKEAGLQCHPNQARTTYPDGTIQTCELSKPVVLDGVPCAAKGQFGNDFYRKKLLPNPGDLLQLHQSGKLHACVLSRDSKVSGVAVEAGSRVTLDHRGTLREVESTGIIVLREAYRCSDSQVKFDEKGRFEHCRLDEPVSYGGRKCVEEIYLQSDGYQCM